MEAAEVYEALGDYGDSAMLALKARYSGAEALVAQHRYDEAEAAFAALGSYSDSADRIMKTRYAKAEYTAESGDPLGAARLFAALSDYADAPARQQAMYDVYYGEAMNPAILAFNESRFEDAIAIVDSLDLSELPDRYGDLLVVYKQSCYLLGNQLYDAGKPYEALKWYRLIPGYRGVDNKLQKGCYLILGSWTDLQGNVYTFRDDGSCLMNGLELFFTVDGENMYTGDDPDVLAMTHRLTGVNRQHAWLYEQAGDKEITIYLTRMN